VSAGCGAKKKGESDDGTVSIAESLSQTLATLAKTLQPPALAGTNAALRLANAASPCAGVEGSDPFEKFLRCQPNLLAAYMGQAVRFIDEAKALVDELETTLDETPAGAETTVELPDDETLVLRKETTETYALLLRSGTDAIFWAERTATTLAFKLAASELSAAVEADDDGIFSAEYTLREGATTAWRSVITASALPCDPADVGGPERMRLVADYEGSTWLGRAATYHPRGGEATCEDEPADATAMNVYTEYRAEDAKATADVFMVPRTVKSTASLSTYAIQDVCDHFPDYCPPSGVAEDLTLPLCLALPSTGGQTETTWGEGCTETHRSELAELGDGAFAWPVPAEFHAAPAEEFPEGLALAQRMAAGF
jgi:hypothetical protein